ncbi:MAG: glycine cleavage system protein H [Ignavibacteria bacterium]
MVAVLVFLAIMFMVIVDIMIIKASKTSAVAYSPLTSPPVFGKKNLLVPGELLYSKSHIWLKKTDGGYLSGLDDFLLHTLGNVRIVRIVKPGTILRKGDVIMDVEFDSKRLTLRSPVTGKVVNSNTSLLDKPLKDSYNNWVFELESVDLAATDFISGEKISAWLKEEFRRLKDFLGFETMNPELGGVMMYDGGYVVEGVLSLLDEKGIRNFEDRFLRP